MLDEHRQGLREVGADLRAELGADAVGGRAGDRHPVDDPCAVALELLDSVDGSHDDVGEPGLVDEEVGSTASAMRSSTGSSSRGVIVIVLPAAK